MKYFLLSFLLAFSVWAKTGKIVFSEQAVFKVEEKVFLLSDVSKLSADLKNFRCLLGDSFLLESLELDKKHHEAFEDYSSLGVIDLQEEGLYLHKLLKLVKLKTFLGKQSLEIDKNTLKNLKIESCGKLGAYESWPKDFKDLFRLEAFWNDRFSFDSIKLSERELEELKAKQGTKIKGAAWAKLLEEERAKRSRESALAFIKTIEKQVPHELFF